MSNIDSVFGCKSNLSELPEFKTIRRLGWSPTIPDGLSRTSSRTSTLQVSWSAERNPEEDCLDYTIEPDFCRSINTDTGEYQEDNGVSVQRQLILNSINPETLAAFSRRCSSKFVENIPSLLSPVFPSGEQKTIQRLAKDKHAFESGMNRITTDICTIQSMKMVEAYNANETITFDARLPPRVVFVKPSQWPQRTKAGVDQARAIRASTRPKSDAPNQSKDLVNAMNGTTKTLDKLAKFRMFLRQHDGSRMLIGWPKKPLQIQSEQKGEGSKSANFENNGGENSPSVVTGDETGLPAFVCPDSEDDVTEEAWQYLQGGGGYD